MQIFFDTKSAQKSSSIILCRIAAQVSKFIFKFGHLDAILVREIFLRIESRALLHDFPHDGVSHQDSVKYSLLIKFKVVLTQNGQAFSRTHFNRTFVGFKISGNCTEQG